MNCPMMSNLYVRSNGDFPCYDDAGEKIIFGRIERGWSIERILTGPVYTHIVDAMEHGRVPWKNICVNCGLFRPLQKFTNSISQKIIHTLQIEPSLACTLKCPGCSQSVQIRERPKPFFMELEVFRTLLLDINRASYRLDEIEYCGQGEPVLNPHFREIVQMARDLCPDTRQRLITNGNHDYSKTIGDVGIDQIIVSCDGAYQASYEKYRIGGSIERVFNFISAIPQEVAGVRQDVLWKYILFEFNDSDEEILTAQDMADEFCVRLMFVVTHSVHKSLRYTIDNLHELPLRSQNAIVDATPMHSKDERVFTAVDIDHPQVDSTKKAIFMIDEFSLNQPGRFRLRGWVLAERKVKNLLIYHNGVLIGAAHKGDRREDVCEAFPEYRDKNAGFSMTWHSDVNASGSQNIRAVLLTEREEVVGSFTRKYIQ